jgi:hypothetical protein
MLRTVVRSVAHPIDEFSRRWKHRARVSEALVLLVLAGAAQRWLPMRRWSWVLGRAGSVPPTWRGVTVDALAIHTATLVEQRTLRAVHRAAQLAWWTPQCLHEATAAQVLLRQQGEPGVVVIGLRPSHGDTWETHAWVMGRKGSIAGGAAAEGFTATAVFEVPGGLLAAELQLG